MQILEQSNTRCVHLTEHTVFLNRIRASKSLNLPESICICNRFNNVFDMYIQIHARDLFA